LRGAASTKDATGKYSNRSSGSSSSSSSSLATAAHISTTTTDPATAVLCVYKY
jgi:hypothetical protein